MIDKIHPGYAAIDLGQEKIFIACAGDSPVRRFCTFRADHLRIGASHMPHRQRALDLMHVRLHTVISQIHGGSGWRVVRAILAGERDPVALSALCDRMILKRKRQEVLKSRAGDWREHHLFAWRQALAGYAFCLRQAAACDQEIEALLQRIHQDEPPATPDPEGKTVVGQIFREAVMSLAKSKHLALGAAERRIKAHRGAAIAVTAIARKLAALDCRLMTQGLHYVEQGLQIDEARHQEQTLRYLKKTAENLGFSLAPANP